MTLARTALRLCVSATLKGTSDARPTLAEGRVYDSRISEFAPESSPEDAKPTVIVLTDGDEGEGLSEQNGGAPFLRMIDLVIEFGMMAALQNDDGYSISYPDTDKRLEASLDTLEFQIIRRLSYELDPLPILFRKFVRIKKHDCHRQVMDDTGVKVAVRVLTLTCEVNDDQVMIYNTSPTASPAVPTGLDVLPEPLLSVAKAMPAGSSELDICTAIAAALAPITTGPLVGLDTTFDADPADPAQQVHGTIELPQS